MPLQQNNEDRHYTSTVFVYSRSHLYGAPVHVPHNAVEHQQGVSPVSQCDEPGQT